MKVVVFGATGRTGQPLVEQALAAGHEVMAFARNPAKLALSHERLQVVQGSLDDAAAVERAVAGQDAVILALGHVKDSPKDVLSQATEKVIAAMKTQGVRRLVNVTGAGVPDPENDQPKLFNRVMSFLLKVMAGALLADSERQMQMIRESGLDWTVVRVPMLTEGPHTGEIKVGAVGRGTGPRISRADVAEFMLRQLGDQRYLHSLPMISN
jgi:putative NADH-flavin reductase